MGQLQPYPQFVLCKSVGRITLYEHRYDCGAILRGYEAEATVKPAGFGELKFCYWPPDIAPLSAAEIARFVDSTWDRMFAEFDRITSEAIPFVEAAIAESYENDAPQAGPMMSRETLNMIGINAIIDPQRGSSHFMDFWAAEFVGGHDLSIRLNADLNPYEAFFDG